MAQEKKKPKKDKKKADPNSEREIVAIAEAEAEAEVVSGNQVKEWLPLFDTVPAPEMTDAAKEEVAVLVAQLERGEMPTLPQSRPMPKIGPRCHELRVREADGNWRIFYRVDSDCIVAVHVFWKTTQTTPNKTIKLCQRRFKQYDASMKAFHAQQEAEAAAKAKRR